MNKDVIYIEPEDDITDIITKIENSKEKIVALVPPKKAGVFRSIVNIKLISKAAASAEKTAVLVTTDPSIVKLAATTKLPVTKNLQSAPVIPKVDNDIEKDTTSEEDLVEPDDEAEEKDVEEEEGEKEQPSDTDEGEDEDETDSDEEEGSDEDNETDSDEDDDSENDSDEKTTKGKKSKKAKKTAKEYANKLAKSDNPVLKWIGTHPKLTAGLGAGFVLLILIGIWAFAIAPAVTITVSLNASKGNFSENVTFTEKLEEENSGEGKFYLTEKKIEDKSEVEFEATGKKNVGEKAKGTLVVYYDFPVAGDGGKIAINAGTAFTNNNLTYTVDESSSISWDGDVTTAKDDCENFGQPGWKAAGCRVSRKINVTATAPGSNYNTSAGNGWNSAASVRVSSASIGGGTDQTVTVVQQSDIDKAKEELAKKGDDTENPGKDRLYESLEDSDFVIESSYRQTVNDAVSTPAVGEEVKEGEKAKLAATTTYSVYVVDKTKVEEFIHEKAKLAENFKIYSVSDPFVENFIKTDAGWTGKLKTAYTYGPKVTENEIIEIVKGKGLGVAQHDIKDIEGIGPVHIDTSVPWVSAVPGDPEKITVILEIKENWKADENTKP